MRFQIRNDLGGYAAKIDVLKDIASTEIEKPFVLLTGPNGAGKSALLRSIRATTGVIGERAGRFDDGSGFNRPADTKVCGNDPGKLAGYVRSMGGTGFPKEVPGVIDLNALGWKGQRTWLFDSRSETKLQGAGTFDADVGYHANLIMSSKTSSHGQMLHHGWLSAISWALGIQDVEDGYDDPEHVPPSRRKLIDLATGGGPRSEERWLFLDEPETALDAERLMIGLCTLIEHAEVGKLRVFCASHSPMFAAGLADHPSVQVLDLGGPRPWFNLQRWAIEAARKPDIVADISRDIAGKLRKGAEDRTRQAAKEREREISEAAKGLTRKQQELILSTFVATDMTLTKDKARDGLLDQDTIRSLSYRSRNLVKDRGTYISPVVTLTELGVAVAERLTRRIEKRMEKEAAGPAMKP